MSPKKPGGVIRIFCHSKPRHSLKSRLCALASLREASLEMSIEFGNRQQFALSITNYFNGNGCWFGEPYIYINAIRFGVPQSYPIGSLYVSTRGFLADYARFDARLNEARQREARQHVLRLGVPQALAYLKNAAFGYSENDPDDSVDNSLEEAVLAPGIGEAFDESYIFVIPHQAPHRQNFRLFYESGSTAPGCFDVPREEFTQVFEAFFGWYETLNGSKA